MDGQAYYQSLVAQGYSPGDATKFTQQHYPGFGQVPAAPQPAVMPAPQPMVAPIPQPMVAPIPQPMAVPTPQPQMISGQVGALVQPMVVSRQSTNTSKGIRITNGIFGILMSLALIGYSIFMVGEIEELKQDLEEIFEEEGYEEGDADLDAWIEDADSFISTLTILYIVAIVIALVVLIMSFMQFMDKPWGTKGLLGSVIILAIMLFATGYYETSAVNGLISDAEDVSGEEIGSVDFAESSGAIGGYCAGLCLGLYALLAFIGRPKSPSVHLVMN